MSLSRLLPLLLPAVLLAGCFDTKSDDDDDDDDDDPSDVGTWDSGGGWDSAGDGETDTTPDTDTGGATTAACAWGGGGLSLDITAGDPGGYDLGLAETISSSDAWTGEDCYLGYVTGDGTLFQYCHPMADDGGFLATVSSFGDLSEGSTTLFSAEIRTTYFLEEVATGFCWTWGDDPTYYGGLGCEEPALACAGD